MGSPGNGPRDEPGGPAPAATQGTQRMSRMTQPGEPLDADGGARMSGQQIRKMLDGRYVCPFCGSVNPNPGGGCPRCSMENTPATRKATKVRIGPWYVLQSRNPSAPGMRFETLLAFVRKGRVRPRSVVRGPTTHQLWRFAAHVKGLSREFGVCYSCGGNLDAGAATNICPHCNRLQEPPINPDVLLESPTGDAGAAGTASKPAAASAAAAAAAARAAQQPSQPRASGSKRP